MTGAVGRLGPLAERRFRLLFAGRTISLLGSAFAPVALAFAVLDDLSGTPSELGLVLAALWLPQMALTLFGGVWADRLPRHLVMVASDLVMFAAQTAVAVLLLTETAELWHVSVLQLVRGAANAFFYPASTGLVPHVVSAPRLQQANALLRLSQSSTGILGAAVAGAVVATAGAGWALAFDALTFLASAMLLARLELPRAIRIPGTNVLAELREGWDEFRARTWVWAVVLAAAIGNLCIMAGVTVLGPVVADRSLGGPAAWGALVAAEAVGLLLGGLVALRYTPARPLLVGCAALLLPVAFFAALAVPAPLPVIAAAAVVQGFGFELFTVFWDTALQQHVPHERLSRVSAYDALGSFVFIPLGLTIAGPLAASIGTAETIWAAGAVFLVAVLALFASAQVRTLRRVEVQRDAAIAAS